MRDRFDADFELHKAGLKDLPYEPLEEPVGFVTTFRSLTIPIVPGYTEIVRGRPYTIEGVRVKFSQNGFYYTHDPRISGFLISRMNAMGRGCEYQLLPNEQELAEANYINERMRQEVAKLKDRLKEEYDSSSRKQILRDGDTQIVEKASEAGLRDAKRLYDISAFAAEQRAQVERIKEGLDPKTKPEPQKKTKAKGKKTKPVEEPTGVPDTLDLDELLGEGESTDDSS